MALGWLVVATFILACLGMGTKLIPYNRKKLGQHDWFGLGCFVFTLGLFVFCSVRLKLDNQGFVLKQEVSKFSSLDVIIVNILHRCAIAMFCSWISALSWRTIHIAHPKLCIVIIGFWIYIICMFLLSIIPLLIDNYVEALSLRVMNITVSVTDTVVLIILCIFWIRIVWKLEMTLSSRILACIPYLFSIIIFAVRFKASILRICANERCANEPETAMNNWEYIMLVMIEINIRSVIYSLTTLPSCLKDFIGRGKDDQKSDVSNATYKGWI